MSAFRFFTVFAALLTLLLLVYLMSSKTGQRYPSCFPDLVSHQVSKMESLVEDSKADSSPLNSAYLAAQAVSIGEALIGVSSMSDLQQQTKGNFSKVFMSAKRQLLEAKAKLLVTYNA